MGNFENAIPQTIASLEKAIGQKRRDIWAIEAKYLHDCNCEYCTETTQELPDEAEQEVEEINTAIYDTLQTINRLKRHAAINGIEVDTQGNGLVTNNPEASAELSNPSKESL